jgi:hypothetical protein
MIFGEFLKGVKIMGVRLKKKRNKNKPAPPPAARKPSLSPSNSSPAPVTIAAPTQAVMTIDKKNDTIAAIDFFGFSPKLFWSDLRRTAWGTVVILVVLVGVYWVTK